MPIRRLPDDLVNRIAAGEVVERPASVVKELMENSLDAGATRIIVSTAQGGKSFIRVEDNGDGMNEPDLRLSVERHATSKLADDHLDAIGTLGFRGEALASIGSVSDLSIASRPADADHGARLTLTRGKLDGPRPEGMNTGTIVEVQNLFAAIPARRKFLKSDRAETAAITDVVKRLAMTRPDVHFILEGSDRQTANWPGHKGPGAAAGRLEQVIGREFVENAVPVDFEHNGIVMAGYAGLPTFSRANSLGQFFFVNGRAVRDKILLGAARAAYADFLFRDRFPVLALFVAIDPEEVDVNVHPAKAELRFRDAGAVRSAVVRAIGSTLERSGFKASAHTAAAMVNAFRAPEQGVPMDQIDPTQPGKLAANSNDGTRNMGQLASEATGRFGEWPRVKSSVLQGLSEPSVRFHDYSVTIDEEFPLGVPRAQVFENFIVSQTVDGLLLIDQHAAHERLVYERFRRQLHDGEAASQAELIPVVVELPAEDCDRLMEVQDALRKCGLAIEQFGPGSIAVHGTPGVLGQPDVAGLVRDLTDGLAEWGSIESLTEKMDAIIGRMACHGSVRSGRILKLEEMHALLREMEATPHSGQCIHGRPTYVELKHRDIEKLFGRR
jgi:DNA mismatch repair protein MutL